MPKPIVAHLTVNGRPFCEHRGCMAGLADARRADVYVCEFTAWDAAVADAEKLAAVLPGRVALAVGPCPEA